MFFSGHNIRERRIWQSRLALLLLFASFSLPARAHNGPPFPIVENRQVGPVVISVWTNPDVGTGTFFVLVDAAPGGKVPDDLKVDIGVQPLSGRLPEKKYSAWREKLRGQLEYKVLVPFDAEETWRVRVSLASAQGSGEAAANVQVTPPGLGRWDLLLYLLPFLGIGFLWTKAVMSKRQRKVMAVQAKRSQVAQG